MSHLYGHRHKFWGLIAGEAEHQTLVACALLFMESLSLGDALRDVGALFADRNHYGAVFAVEAQLGVVVTDFLYSVPDDGGYVDDGGGGDFAGDYGHIVFDQRFAGDPAFGVLSEHCIEDGVRNVVGHFIGMAHCYGFAGEEKFVAVTAGVYRFFCHLKIFLSISIKTRQAE